MSSQSNPSAVCAQSNAATQTAAVELAPREWIASLDLDLQRRQSKTRLVGNHHYGPLRVQRPFYPEPDGCAHVYLLHPPGGVVVGDQLTIAARVGPSAGALLTTPSANKFYGVQGAETPQCQRTLLEVAAEGCLEWLPQETIVFDGANADSVTEIQLHESARFCAWDIVCLGRPASNAPFNTGRCLQQLVVRRGDRPLLIERNRFVAQDPMSRARWGFAGHNTSGTFLASVELTQSQTDHLVAGLDEFGAEHRWGVTQKEGLLLVRYSGQDTAVCRRGFEWVWRETRSTLNGKAPVAPRIWST